MIVKIFPKKCIACGLCQVYAPELFNYHDSGIVYLEQNSGLLEQKVPMFLEDKCLLAYQKCPSQAINLKK